MIYTILFIFSYGLRFNHCYVSKDINLVYKLVLFGTIQSRWLLRLKEVINESVFIELIKTCL